MNVNLSEEYNVQEEEAATNSPFFSHQEGKPCIRAIIQLLEKASRSDLFNDLYVVSLLWLLLPKLNVELPFLSR